MKVISPAQQLPRPRWGWQTHSKDGRKEQNLGPALLCTVDSHELKIKDKSLLCGKHRAMFAKVVERPEGQWVAAQGLGTSFLRGVAQCRRLCECPARGSTHGRQGGGCLGCV